jgi:hypothetical protein
MLTAKMAEYPPDVVAMAALSQRLLVEFLETELNLGFTYLKTASPAANHNIVLARVRTTLENIRTFRQ